MRKRSSVSNRGWEDETMHSESFNVVVKTIGICENRRYGRPQDCSITAIESIEIQ